MSGLRERPVMRYNFGVYHWRRRARRLALGSVAVAVAVRLYRGTASVAVRVFAVALALWGVRAAGRAAAALARSPPWRLDREQYAALAAELPLATADRVLDVGCGTGRSLVGLAPAVPPSCRVFGLDVFDERVILGNGPGLARRNARVGGLDPVVVRGDAARLPFADDSMDVVTACRVLHDLPADAAKRALAEAHRVCLPDGALGVLELPVTHVDSSDPAAYWRDLVADAGFTVTTVRVLDLDRGRYVVVVAEP